MRRTRPPSAGSTKKVSCIWRAGWSLPRLSASKFIHSDSTSGPSTTSQPIPTKASIEPFLGQLQRVPGAGRAAVHRPGDVDGLLDEDPPVALVLELGLAASRAPGRARPAAAPTRLPASALALGGRAPISRLASATAPRSTCAMPGGLELVEAWSPPRTRRSPRAPRRRAPPGRERRPRQGRTGCSVRTSPSFPCRPGGRPAESAGTSRRQVPGRIDASGDVWGVVGAWSGADHRGSALRTSPRVPWSIPFRERAPGRPRAA